MAIASIAGSGLVARRRGPARRHAYLDGGRQAAADGTGAAAPPAIAFLPLGPLQGLTVPPPQPGLWTELHALLEAPAKLPSPAQATPPAAPATYTVASGDSLSAIAARELGDADRWHELYDANRDVVGPDPNLIHPGQVLTLPGKAAAAPEPAPEPAPAPAPAPPPAPPGGQYTVVSGDSLSAIAQKTLGDGNRWRELYDLNRDVIGPNPGIIHPGQVLRLPGGAQAPAPAPGPAVTGNTPYVNQYSPAGKEQGYTNGGSNCGPASMAMVARAAGYGNDLSDAKLISHLGGIGHTTAAGTGVNGIAAMAQAMGLNAQTRGPGAQVDWIAAELRAGRKVVANGDYVLVYGIDGNGRFLVHDPADRRVTSVSAAELDTFIRSNPNGGYQISVGR